MAHPFFILSLVLCQFRTAHRIGQNCSFHKTRSADWLDGRFEPGAGLPSTVGTWCWNSLLWTLVDTERTKYFSRIVLCEVAELPPSYSPPPPSMRRDSLRRRGRDVKCSRPKASL